MSRLFQSIIIENRVVTPDFRVLAVNPIGETGAPKPGQFYMLQVGTGEEPLLKRPLSIFRQRNGTLEFLYRIRGKGTRLLSSLSGGTEIQMLGPLGNGYPGPEGDFIAVAGGTGIASIFFLLESFPGRGYLFCGARTCDELLMLDEVRPLVKEICVTTDDGSYCSRGYVTEHLERGLATVPRLAGLPVYACGPEPMLHELTRLLDGRGMQCFVSLEEYMACGMGACLGCVAETKNGYKRVCKEGPVFPSGDILWK